MTVTINGTTGYSGPVGTIGDLTTTGNTTLGDASGDTLTLNGNTASIPNNLNFTNGNLGLGATPSAWSSSWKALQTNNGYIGNATSNNIAIGGNNYVDSGGAYRYITSAAANQYQLAADGSHFWRIAGSGTAGNAITWTQALTLDSAGNLGLGVTPSAWISTNKAFQFGYGAVRAFTNSANTYLDNNNYVNSSGTDIYLNNGYAGRYRIADNQHIWYQAASGTAGNSITFTQAMTLDSNGKLLVGLTSATGFVSNLIVNRQGVTNSPILSWTNATSNSGHCHVVSGGGAGVTADGFLSFGSGEAGAGSFTERMRITSGGTVIVGTGTTSSTDTMLIYPASGDALLNLKGPGAYIGLNSTASGYSNIQGLDNGTLRWRLGQSAYGGADGCSIYYGSSATEATRFASTVEMYRPMLLRSGLADTYSGALSGNYTSGTWYTLANSGNLGSGVFILTVYVDTYLTGSVYYMIYASVPFYIYNVGSNNGSTFTLPTMYGTGHADNGIAPPSIRLRLTYGGGGIYVDLNPSQTWTGLDGTGGKNVNFAFKRIG